MKTLLAGCLALALAGCGDITPAGDGTGGAPGTGGAAADALMGAAGSDGAAPDVAATADAGSGGAPGTGGTSGTGGAPGTGGAGTGGSSGTGGAGGYRTCLLVNGWYPIGGSLCSTPAEPRQSLWKAGLRCKQCTPSPHFVGMHDEDCLNDSGPQELCVKACTECATRP